MTDHTRSRDPASGSASTIGARVGRSPLVGRAAELGVVRNELALAARGESRVVLLAGEAGIGKSRLIEEAIGLAIEAGWQALLGRCADEHGVPPFLPWIDATAHHRTPASSPTTPPIDIDPAAACRELHSLRRTLTATGTQPDPDRRSETPEQRALRRNHAVALSLGRLARAQPLLVAFDDLQWSDAASNELLRYVMVHGPVAPLLVLAAYRSEEAIANVDLAHTIAELQRRRLATTVPIGPLDIAAANELVTDLLQRHDPRLAEAIHHRGEGNPFAIEELARTLVEEGLLDGRHVSHGGSTVLPSTLRLPEGVVAIVARRLGRVRAETRFVLELGALAGREIAVEWLAVAAPAEPADVAARLEEATRAALVRRLGDEADRRGGSLPPADYAFLHDRVRESIAAQIDPVRRRDLHALLARALESLGGAEDDVAWLAALAHHFHLARLPREAAVYAARLGDAAMRTHAHAEAVRAYHVAVTCSGDEALSGLGLPPRADLLLRLGDAALFAGDPRAITAYTEAKAAFAARSDQRGVARALHRLGAAHARREEFEPAVAYLEAALAALVAVEADASADPAWTGVAKETAAVLLELGEVLGTSLARYEEAIAAGRRGLALIQAEDGWPATEAHARLALAKTLTRAGDLGGGEVILAPALALALRADQPGLAAEVAGALANHHYWVGDLAASEQATRHRRALGRQAGDPFALRHAGPWLANLALARGDRATADQLLAEAEADIGRIESPEPRAFLRQLSGLIRFQQGRYREAVDLLSEAVTGFRSSGPATLVWYIGCLALAHLAAGDETAAERVAHETEDLVADLPSGSLPRCPALAQLGIVAAQRGNLVGAERWYEALRPYAGQHHWVLVDRVRGMLAAALGDAPVAAEHFAAAAQLATTGGIRPELALTLAEHGATLCRSRMPADRATGSHSLREALKMLQALGMAGEVGRFSSFLAELSPLSAQPPAYPAGLTEREVEVLALVAEGLTNRKIGERPGISDKTVTNHLSHIFTKADLDNRAAAAAFAFRHGLV